MTASGPEPRQQEPPWFRQDDLLVEQLRESHAPHAGNPVIPGYVDLRFLERGGQGTVYVAKQEKDGRRVALKVFHERPFDSLNARRRFEREIQLASRLDHPAIVRLHRIGHNTEGLSFLAMEYVQGDGFVDYTKACSIEEVIELGVQISNALAHAHRRGVIHRDLKPANLLVDRAGNARLLDFGLAKPVRKIRSKDGFELSATGQFLGTLRWSSPEQLSGHPDDVGIETDIYSMGVLMFFALAGRMPYDVDGSVADMATSIRDAAPEPLRRYCPDASSDLETVLLRCLAKDPQRRYATMAELSRDLNHTLVGSPIEARRDSLAFALRSLVAKHRLASFAIVMTAVSLVAFSLVSSHFYRQARRANVQTEIALEAKRMEAEKIASVNEFLLGSFLAQGVPPEELDALPLQKVLTQASTRIETESSLTDKPEVRADLHTAYAYWFLAIPNKVERSIQHADQALRLYGSIEEPSRTQLAWAYEVRGTAHLKSQRFTPARADLENALQVYREANGEDLNIARVLAQIASCAFAMDEIDGIAPYLLESKDIFLKHFGAGHPQVAAIDQALQAIEGRKRKQ